jgi:hypothetical protein
MIAHVHVHDHGRENGNVNEKSSWNSWSGKPDLVALLGAGTGGNAGFGAVFRCSCISSVSMPSPILAKWFMENRVLRREQSIKTRLENFTFHSILQFR